MRKISTFLLVVVAVIAGMLCAAIAHAQTRTSLTLCPKASASVGDKWHTVQSSSGTLCLVKDSVAPAPAPVPAPTPTPGTGSHEPAGMTLITDRAFNAVGSCAPVNNASCADEDGWGMKVNVANTFAIATDATAPKSPANVGRMIYPAGQLDGNSFSRTCKTLSGTQRTLYVSAWIEYSANYLGHPLSNINKLFYAYLENGSRDVALETNGGNADPLHDNIVFQNLAAKYPDSWGGAGDFTVGRVPNVANPEFTRGAWHRMEYLLTANAAGASDGSFLAWQDGVQTYQLTGITYTTSGAGWSSFCFDPIRGGIATTVPQTMYLQADHMYISGK